MPLSHSIPITDETADINCVLLYIMTNWELVRGGQRELYSRAKLTPTMALPLKFVSSMYLFQCIDSHLVLYACVYVGPI